MTNTQTLMDVPSAFRSLYWPVALLLAAALALLSLLGYGPGGLACRPALVATAPAPVAPAPVPAPPPAPVAAAPVAAAPVAAAPVAAAPVAAAPVVAAPATKLFFEVDRSEVSAAERAKTGPIVEYLKANPAAKAVVSGFHDPRGDRAKNEALALDRARAVRAVLEEQGIARERVVMAKPMETTGDGSLPEARRVELSVEP
jgi:K(+)-stimulated pyrophosphate-energized sodium pump